MGTVPGASQEPTSALDPDMTKEVLNVMIALADQGMTMLVVTHEMSSARSVAELLVFMDQGEVVEKSPPAEFFDNPESDRTKLFLNWVFQSSPARAVPARGPQGLRKTSAGRTYGPTWPDWLRGFGFTASNVGGRRTQNVIDANQVLTTQQPITMPTRGSLKEAVSGTRPRYHVVVQLDDDHRYVVDPSRILAEDGTLRSLNVDLHH